MTINYYGGGYPGLSSTWLALAFVGVSCLYLVVVSLGFHLSSKISTSLSVSWLLLGALLLGGALLFLPVVFSPDMQSYIAASQAGARYYANPPAAFLSASSPALYGPSWLAIVGLLVNISNHNPLLLTSLLRGIELLAHLANTCLIWAILARVAPAQRLPGTLLYAWNPLVLLELVGNGHDDGLVICLLLLALWLYMRRHNFVGARAAGQGGEGLYGRPQAEDAKPSTEQGNTEREQQGTAGDYKDPPRPHISTLAPTGTETEDGVYWLYEIAVLILIGLAIGMDWLALVIAPLALLFMAHNRSKIAWPIKGFIWRAILVLVVAAITYLPIWQGGATFVALISSTHPQIMMHSLLALLDAPLKLLYTLIFTMFHIRSTSFAPVDPTDAANITIITSALFLFLLLYIREVGRARKYETLFTGLCIVMAAFVALASTIFWPWYLVWIVWVAALRPYDTLTKTMLLFSCAALLYYPMLSLDGTPLAFLMPLCIFGIPSVYFVGAKVWIR